MVAGADERDLQVVREVAERVEEDALLARRAGQHVVDLIQDQHASTHLPHQPASQEARTLRVPPTGEAGASAKERSSIAHKGIVAATKAKPASFFQPALASRITPCNYDDDGAKLADCDWIVEVVVERLEAEEKTASGIIIPDSAQEKPMQGKIIAAGSGARDETGKIQPLDVKEGDVVLFGKWSGTEVKLDGKDLLIMKESDIMGIMG